MSHKWVCDKCGRSLKNPQYEVKIFDWNTLRTDYEQFDLCKKCIKKFKKWCKDEEEIELPF